MQVEDIAGSTFEIYQVPWICVAYCELLLKNL